MDKQLVIYAVLCFTPILISCLVAFFASRAARKREQADIARMHALKLELAVRRKKYLIMLKK